ncbi:MAG TPA: nucleoside monophosphate kinase [Acidimicrobiia bacterium]|nr:nucleoside monophosphate kinase [Acidimicrobiia bacterium]
MTAAPLISNRAIDARDSDATLVVLLGPPGAGKGTQCERLARRLGLTHVSTGHALREEVRRGTRLGALAARYLDRGRLVPDALVVDAMTNAIARSGATSGVLLDGFPRTAPQARLLEDLDLGTVRLAVALIVPRAVLLERLRSRGRADDQIDVLRTRLISYETDTRPLLDHYGRRGILVHVDGNRSADEVTATLAGHLVAAGVSPARSGPLLV